MAFWKSIKSRIKRCPTGLLFTERLKKRRYERLLKRMDDRAFVSWLYQKRNGIAPDLENPTLFGEKLQWLKLRGCDERMARCTDKRLLKDYLKEQGFAELAVPTIAVAKSMHDLDRAALPPTFMLKTTHGSGWQFRCDGKERFSWKQMATITDVWLSESLYIYGREPNYRDLEPMVMVEPLLSDKPLCDYKFFCFDGTAHAVQTNRTVDDALCVDFYDMDWNRLSGVRTAGYPNAAVPIEKPSRFDDMVSAAQTLSKPFSFVRVDMYETDGRLFVGEMTFFPSSGLHPITPLEWETIFGEWLCLPKG